jgi:hypothetical protein
MAQLATADLGGRCVTTGCPNLWWKTLPEIKATNYINGEDIITKVPPFYRRDGMDRFLPSKVGCFKSHLPHYYYKHT